MLETTQHDGISVLQLAHGKVNALDVELFEALEAALEKARNDAEALVLTGSGRVFSAGVDLFRIIEGGDDYLDRFLPALSRISFDLFTFPKPVVIAVNGHAIAGGCIIACTGDARIGVHGHGRIGIPELRVGVPFPVTALEVMRFAVGDRRLPQLALGGATYEPDAAREVGLLDRIVEPEDLHDAAVGLAREFVDLGPAFAVAKRQLRQPTVERIVRERPASDDEILAMWKSPATRATIREYLDRTLAS